MPPSEITTAVSTLDSLDGVTVIEELYQQDDSSKWILKIQLQPDDIQADSQIPRETDWYVHLDSTYPGGNIQIYPAKEGSITSTYPHQRLNVAGNEDTPWREGNLCVARYGHIIGRSGATGEPTSASDRLQWQLERALAWLEAASKGELRQEEEPFELPIFSANAAPPTRFAFNESSDSLKLWQSKFGSWGAVDLVQLSQPSDVFLTQEFQDEDGDVVYQPEWGNYITSHSASQVRGAWLLLEERPIEPPWRVPETWGDLAELLEDTAVNPFELRVHIDSILEDNPFNCLLLGFPIPSEVGGPPELIHWQAIELPDLTPVSERLGFRETPRDKEIAAKVDLSRETIRWLDSDNWAHEQLSRRGHIRDSLRNASILLIGAGALGSTVAECLVRDGCRDLTIVDGEEFEIGNLARHSLTLPCVRENKAKALASRLNSISPHVDAVGLSEAFPLDDESMEGIDSVDVVIDCTASNTVLHALDSYLWGEPVLFCSASMGRRANRLFYFTAYSLSFPYSQFRDQYEPWRLQEQIEWQPGEDAVPERVGCWHPASVIRMDRVMTWSGTITRLLDQGTSLGLGGTEFKVLETGNDDSPMISEADAPFQAVERWIAPDSDVTVEIPASCLEAMIDLCTAADSLETGGILAGTTLKETTALIIRARDPPRDSTQGPMMFHRGTERVDEWLREARDSMGIHYLGEWHYHPSTSPDLSRPDRAQMNEIASTESYGCPHPIMFIIGGHASEQFAVRAYLFHRDRNHEELKHTGPPERPNRPTSNFELDIVFPHSRESDIE
jgi:proteasome lid subunit RPN8/RPN11